MAESWALIAKTTIAEHLKEVEPVAVRRRVIPGMLSKAGRITFNHSGDKIDWRIATRRNTITPYDDMATLSFQRLNRYEVAELPWRGYTATEAYSELDKQKNKGDAAIVKAVSQIFENMRKDAEESFHEEFWVDGNASGNTSKYHGLESIFGTSGTVAGNTEVLAPSDTYAGLSTVLGTYGGTWDTNASSQVVWPNQQGDFLYEFWSPLVLNVLSSNWGGSTWKENCMTVMRFALTARERNMIEDRKNVFFLIDRNWHRELKDELSLKEKINVQLDKETSNLISLGFKSTIFDGYEVVSDYGIPNSSNATDARQGYLLDINEIELMNLYDSIWKPEGPEKSMQNQAYIMALTTFGNLRFTSPRHQVKLTAA